MTKRQLRHATNYQKLKDMGFNNKDATRCKFWSPKAIDRMQSALNEEPTLKLIPDVLMEIGRGWPRNAKK